MNDQRYQNAVELVKNMQYQEALEALKEIIDLGNEDDTHFQALKLCADIVGPLAYHDYLAAVDLYQNVINNTEDDELYNQCQLGILNAYLSLSLNMMESYEGLRDVLETEDPVMLDMVARLDQRREEFITSRAEAIYKRRL